MPGGEHVTLVAASDVLVRNSRIAVSLTCDQWCPVVSFGAKQRWKVRDLHGYDESSVMTTQRSLQRPADTD